MSMYQICECWEEPDCSPYECYQCEEKEDQLSDAADYLQGVLQEIYSQDKMDLELLEHNIENLCHVLNVKMPEGQVQIERTQQHPRSIAEWINFNTNYLKACAGA